MATRNSKPRLVHEVPDSAVPAINLVSINPLLSDIPGDTATKVDAVLAALSNFFNQVDLDSGIAFDLTEGMGIALILDTCRAALDHAHDGAA